MAGENAGRSGHRWRTIKADLKQRSRESGAKCWLCLKPIDYDLPHSDPMAFQPDHIKPWAHFPELREDPANLMPSHAWCNKNRGDRDPLPNLGMTSKRW